MSFSHVLTISLSGGAVNLTGKQTVTADSKQSYDIPLTASQINAEVDADFDFANLVSVFIISDQNLTIKTNSSSAPDDTITVTANVPFVWNTAQAADNPFTANVTKFFLTNGAAVAARAQIEILCDSTP